MAKNLQNFKRFDKQVEELLAKMTLKEKIGQLNQASRAKNPEQQKFALRDDNFRYRGATQIDLL